MKLQTFSERRLRPIGLQASDKAFFRAQEDVLADLLADPVEAGAEHDLGDNIEVPRHLHPAASRAQIHGHEEAGVTVLADESEEIALLPGRQVLTDLQRWLLPPELEQPPIERQYRIFLLPLPFDVTFMHKELDKGTG